MAGTYNKVILIGRLGRDPELKYTQTGTPVANMSLATNETYFDREGNRQERTDWHRIVVWNKQAENVANYLSKGRMALVEGSLQTRKYQDNQGQDRYITEVRAQRVVFMDGQGQGSSPAPGGGSRGGQDPFDSGTGSSQESQENYGPAFPSEASAMDDAPF